MPKGRRDVLLRVANVNADSVITHTDRAVVGRVSISYDKLDSTDPHEFLRKPTLGLYAGRLGLAILFAAIITEPLMLARYQGEIDARLNEVHNQQLSRIDTGGVIGTW